MDERVSADAYLRAQMQCLVIAAGEEDPGADVDAWEVPGSGAHGLSVRASVAPGATRVELGGWTKRFEPEADSADAREQAEVFLDLVGAALFGGLRVRRTMAGTRAVKWTLQIQERDGWNTISSTGRLNLNPFAKSTHAISRNERPRPSDFEPAEHIGLPWAPWAGAAGFYRVEGGASEPAPLALDGVLDLHNFSPKQVKPLVTEYMAQCREHGVLELRIIHGKGKGQLRRTVHSILDGHEAVEGYELGGHGGGSWGATVVSLRPLEP